MVGYGDEAGRRRRLRPHHKGNREAFWHNGVEGFAATSPSGLARRSLGEAGLQLVACRDPERQGRARTYPNPYDPRGRDACRAPPRPWHQDDTSPGSAASASEFDPPSAGPGSGESSWRESRARADRALGDVTWTWNFRPFSSNSTQKSSTRTILAPLTVSPRRTNLPLTIAPGRPPPRITPLTCRPGTSISKPSANRLAAGVLAGGWARSAAGALFRGVGARSRGAGEATLAIGPGAATKGLKIPANILPAPKTPDRNLRATWENRSVRSSLRCGFAESRERSESESACSPRPGTRTNGALCVSGATALCRACRSASSCETAGGAVVGGVGGSGRAGTGRSLGGSGRAEAARGEALSPPKAQRQSTMIPASTAEPPAPPRIRAFLARPTGDEEQATGASSQTPPDEAVDGSIDVSSRATASGVGA